MNYCPGTLKLQIKVSSKIVRVQIFLLNAECKIKRDNNYSIFPGRLNNKNLPFSNSKNFSDLGDKITFNIFLKIAQRGLFLFVWLLV